MRTAINPPTNPRHPAAATHVQTRPVGSADGRTSRASFLYEFLLVTPGVAAIPAVPEVPAIPERVESLFASNVSMTPEQWAAYPAGGNADSDAIYEHACVLTNLGVTPAA